MRTDIRSYHADGKHLHRVQAHSFAPVAQFLPLDCSFPWSYQQRGDVPMGQLIAALCAYPPWLHQLACELTSVFC